MRPSSTHTRTRSLLSRFLHPHSLIRPLAYLLQLPTPALSITIAIAIAHSCRYVHLGRDDLGDNDRLVSDQARTIMSEEVQELDYLSQVVFCMYENKRVPIDDPRRFRVEILFSPGERRVMECILIDSLALAGAASSPVPTCN